MNQKGWKPTSNSLKKSFHKELLYLKNLVSKKGKKEKERKRYWEVAGHL